MRHLKTYLSTALFSTLVASQAFAACLPPFECARITGIPDIDLGDYDFASNVVATQDFCVYTQNDDDSNHALLFFGTGAGDELVINSGARAITGSIDIAEQGVTPPWYTLTPNVKQILPNPNTSSETCAVGGDSVTLRIRFTAADIDSVGVAGTYTSYVYMQSSLD